MENSGAVQYCVLQKLIIIRIPTINLSGMLYRHDFLSVPLPIRWIGLQVCHYWSCDVQTVLQDLYLAPCGLFLQFWIILVWIFLKQYEYRLFLAVYAYRLRSICTKYPLFTSVMDLLFWYRFGKGGGVYFINKRLVLLRLGSYERKRVYLFWYSSLSHCLHRIFGVLHLKICFHGPRFW